MGNIPTAEEFNRKMYENTAYWKLVELEKHLKKTMNWFGDNIDGIDITKLYDVICKRMKEIPEESINFHNEVHGETTNI